MCSFGAPRVNDVLTSTPLKMHGKIAKLIRTVFSCFIYGKLYLMKSFEVKSPFDHVFYSNLKARDGGDDISQKMLGKHISIH